MKLLKREELLKIAASLEDYHKIFYVFWELSSISFADDIPTAAIRFDEKGGKPQMLLNEEFWERHNHREKLFIICHECLHVLLDHGVRNGMQVPGATHELVNKAQDITINHMIVDLFNYDREDLREWRKYCWIETCFTNPVVIKRNENFIYYLEKLIEDPKSKEEGGPSTLDAHGDPSGESEQAKNSRQSIAKDIAKDLDPGDLEDLIKALPGTDDEKSPAGAMKGVYEAILAEKTKKLKLNFTLLIKKLKRSRLKYVEKDVETFVREDRRFDDLMKRPDVSLPGTSVRDGPIKDRLLTALFMDVSGSCMMHFPLFQQIAKAFDEEREIFDLRTFVFDTTVTEIEPKMSFRVGGGTAFDIIEKKILELEKEYHRYPDCVVVVTDGEGTPVKPKGPTKWIWLLTPPASKQYIPLASRHWLVSQVEFT